MSDGLVYHTVCPFCGAIHDRAGLPVEGEIVPQPNDGDVTLCIQCGEIGVFDGTLTGGLRKPTKKELRELRRNPEVERLREAWRHMRRELRRRS